MNKIVAKILLEFTSLIEIRSIVVQKEDAVRKQDFATAAILREKEMELRKSITPFDELQQLKVDLLHIINNEQP